MARQFRLDLVVATGYLRADPERLSPIQVAVLCMLGPDGTIWWDGTPRYVYPMSLDGLAQVREDVRVLEQEAIENWPALAGACDWWVPDKREFDQTKLIGQEDGNAIGLQEL